MCVYPNFPRTGKVNRVGVASEDHELILSSSSQQPVKSFKGSSQSAVVTKPAAASSADSHISLVVRTMRLSLLSTVEFLRKREAFHG